MVHVILENSAIRTFQFLFKQKTVSVIVSGKDLLFSLNTLLDKHQMLKLRSPETIKSSYLKFPIKHLSKMQHFTQKSLNLKKSRKKSLFALSIKPKKSHFCLLSLSMFERKKREIDKPNI